MRRAEAISCTSTVPTTMSKITIEWGKMDYLLLGTQIGIYFEDCRKTHKVYICLIGGQRVCVNTDSIPLKVLKDDLRTTSKLNFIAKLKFMF